MIPWHRRGCGCGDCAGLRLAVKLVGLARRPSRAALEASRNTVAQVAQVERDADGVEVVTPELLPPTRSKRSRGR